MTKEKYHYHKIAVEPDVKGKIIYNHTTGLLALEEKQDVGQYIGYMTEAEAVEVLENSKSGLRKMSSVNQFRGSR